eukprot:RCo029200
MLSLEETAALTSLLQAENLQLAQILELLQKSFKPEAYPRLAFSLRCLIDDNYFNIDSTGSTTGWSHQAELLITFFLLHTLSASFPARPEDSNPSGGQEATGDPSTPGVHLPNTRSVLYEQLQKLENFIREKRHKKDAKDATPAPAAKEGTPPPSSSAA